MRNHSRCAFLPVREAHLFLSGEAILLGRKTLRWGERLTESAAVLPFGTSVGGVPLDDVSLAAEGTDSADGDFLFRLAALGALLSGRLGASLCRALGRSRFFRCNGFRSVCLYGCYPTDAIVGKNIGNDLCYLIFQLLHEALRVVLLMFDVAQFLFPDASQLGAFQEFFMNQVNQLHTCRCREEILAFLFNITPLEEGFDDGCAS